MFNVQVLIPFSFHFFPMAISPVVMNEIDINESIAGSSKSQQEEIFKSIIYESIKNIHFSVINRGFQENSHGPTRDSF